MAVAEDRRPDLDAVADACASTGKAAAVDLRPTASTGSGGDARAAVASSVDSGSDSGVNLSRSSGILLHPTSLPGGRLGEEAYEFVDWLAAAGQSWWQVLPLGPPGRRRLAVQVAVRVRRRGTGCSRTRARRSRAEELEAFARGSAYWIDDWAAFAGGDAIADQVRFEREWSALREYARGARRAADRRRADLRRRTAAPTTSRIPSSSRRGEVAGVPPDAFTRGRPALGEPALRLDGAARARASAGGSSASGARSSSSTSTRSTTSAASSPTGRSRRGAATARSGRWRRGPGARALRRRASGARRRCR